MMEMSLANDRDNKKLQLRVSAYAESEQAKQGLPVRIIVNQGHELWQGRTDQAGQFWFDCTWLGFLYFGSPTEVEIDAGGKTRRQKFAVDPSGADIRFYLDKEPAQEGRSVDVGKFAGNYQGSISSASTTANKTGETRADPTPASGDTEVHIAIDDAGNVDLRVAYHSIVVTDYMESKSSSVVTGKGKLRASADGGTVSEFGAKSVLCAYRDDSRCLPNEGPDAYSSTAKIALEDGRLTGSIEFYLGITEENEFTTRWNFEGVKK